MKWLRLLLPVGLLLVTFSLTAFVFHPVQSVCYLSDSTLNWYGAQENDLYCAGENIAPSTYPQAIMLAEEKLIIIGTPKQVSTVHGLDGILRVDVEFTRGYYAQHYLINPKGILPWIYDSDGVQVWP